MSKEKIFRTKQKKTMAGDHPYVGEVRGDRDIKCISRDIMNYI